MCRFCHFIIQKKNIKHLNIIKKEEVNIDIWLNLSWKMEGGNAQKLKESQY